MAHAYKTEAEVFGSVNCPLWEKYSIYKVACNLNKEKPMPPEVWVCGQMLKLIDKGLGDTDRKDAEEMLDELGWESYTNAKGQLCLRPRVAIKLLPKD